MVGEREGLELEGYGDIEPAAAADPERGDGLLEAVERGQQCLIDQRLPCLAGEGGVDPGRLAVGDRVADDGVMVHERSVSQLARTWSLLVKVQVRVISITS